MNENQLRHHARRCALQALYQWHFTENDARTLIQQFMEDPLISEMDIAYFKKLVSGTIEHVSQIDEWMSPHLDRKITMLNPVELSVLRLAIYELAYCADVPYKVIIDESLELTKEFGAEAGYKFVNGVLDAAAKKLRASGGKTAR